MIDVNKNNLMKYLLFGSLYFSEGILWIIASLILPIYLVEKNVSLPLTTLVSGIFMLPMTIKFVWGGIADYFIQFGRKRFIILGVLLSSIGLFPLAIIDPGIFLLPFAFFLFICGCGVGFLDVSADAWAIEISHEEERGKINGAMFAGQSAGMVVAASILAPIAQIYGYGYGFLIAGLIVLFIVIFPLVVKETKTIKKRPKVASLLIGEFKKRTTQLTAIFTPLSTINIGLLAFVVPLYMKISLQLDIAQIGLITAIFPVTKVVGSLVGGAIADKCGRKILLYGILGGGGFFSATLIFANNWQIFALLYGIIGFLQGGHYSALGAMLMDVTNPKIGATQFSILSSLGNVGITGAGTAGGSLVTMLGFGRVFLYSAWVFGPALLILHFIRFKKHFRKA